MALVLWFQLHAWKTRMQFQSLGFDLAQFWLLQIMGGVGQWREKSLFVFSLCFWNKVKITWKKMFRPATINISHGELSLLACGAHFLHGSYLGAEFLTHNTATHPSAGKTAAFSFLQASLTLRYVRGFHHISQFSSVATLIFALLCFYLNRGWKAKGDVTQK